MQGAAGADALVSETSEDAEDTYRDELASGHGLLVREMFFAVSKSLPAAVVCEGALGQRVLQTAIAGALPFLRRTLLLRAVVLGNIYIHTYIHKYVYLCVCVYIYMYIHVCVCVCVYEYIYIYIYIHTHTHIYMYIHTHTHTHTHTHRSPITGAPRQHNLPTRGAPPHFSTAPFPPVFFRQEKKLKRQPLMS